MSRVWFLVVAFFSTRGAWYGYVFRVGAIWVGGSSLVHWYVLEYDGRPLAAADVFQIALSRIALGTVAGLFAYGIMRPTEGFMRSRSIAEHTTRRPQA